MRHILPNTVAPLIVQGTYICASAILMEAILSFLGVGLPPDIADLGQHHGRGTHVQFRSPIRTTSSYPGIFLAVTVLAVNILGDGLRDTLDPENRQTDVSEKRVSANSRSSRSAIPVDRAAGAAPTAANAVEDVSFTVNRGEIVCLCRRVGLG